MHDSPTICVCQANGSLPGSVPLFWLFSKNQLEMVLRDIVPLTQGSGHETRPATITWQDQQVPVVSLEKYFGIPMGLSDQPSRYLLLRGAGQDNGEIRTALLVVPIFLSLKTGSLDFVSRPLSPTSINQNTNEILGVYEHHHRIIIVPDIYRISRRIALGAVSVHNHVR